LAYCPGRAGQFNSLFQTVKSTNKYHWIYLLLKDAIDREIWPPGSKIPAEMELVEQYGVSRVTVRRAMAALVEEGLVWRKPGVGTVVTERPKEASHVIVADVSNLVPGIARMSQASSIELLEFAYRLAGPIMASRLKIEPRTRLQYSVRVRKMAGVPFSYLVTHVPAILVQGFDERDLATTPLFQLLEKNGVTVDHATQTISATLANREQAQALQVPEGSPLISLQRIMFDRQGRGIEHLDAYYRPDRFRIQVDLGRVGDSQERYWTPVTDFANVGL